MTPYEIGRASFFNGVAEVFFDGFTEEDYREWNRGWDDAFEEWGEVEYWRRRDEEDIEYGPLYRED